MPSFRTGWVTEIIEERPGLQRVWVVDGDQPPERAYVLTDQVGPVAVGNPVVFNTTAVDLGLGTGGWHVVHWNLARESWSQPGPGHIMKQRYTSLQTDTGAAEEALDPPAHLAGTPVVVCSLHSQVPVVAAAFQARHPGGQVVYVMTDGAALPMALSDLVVSMVDLGLVHATITAGHAFGGMREAVSVPSALALAVHADDADLIVVGMGPGVVGTDSALGTTAVEVAGILDAAAALGGRPICCVRASEADPRPRHRGASHHVSTILALTRSRVEVATVAGAEVSDARHEVHVVDPGDVPALLAERSLEVRSMGRGPDDDPLFFAAAGAAGVLAAEPQTD
ncbi:MAG: DUF3866 family protein [Acidimicrobiales bacterium]|nr:DUF3866 family protein [Acidimicrobiales bacterium]